MQLAKNSAENASGDSKNTEAYVATDLSDEESASMRKPTTSVEGFTHSQAYSRWVRKV